MKSRDVVSYFIVLFVFISSIGIFFTYNRSKNNITKAFLAEQKIILEGKAQNIESLIRNIYEIGRTISNLPSVKNVKEANLPVSFDEENILDVRFIVQTGYEGCQRGSVQRREVRSAVIGEVPRQRFDTGFELAGKERLLPPDIKRGEDYRNDTEQQNNRQYQFCGKSGGDLCNQG